MTGRSIFIPLAVLLLTLYSCVSDYEMYGSADSLVVNCVLTDSDVQTVTLSWIDNDREYDSNILGKASVSLTDLTDDGKSYVFLSQKGGTYSLEYTPKPDHDYQLEVDIDGMKHITAQTIFPRQSSLEVYVSNYYGTFELLDAGSANIWATVMNEDETVPFIASTYPYVDDFNLTDVLVAEKECQTWSDSKLRELLADGELDYNIVSLDEYEQLYKKALYTPVVPDYSKAEQIAERLEKSYYHEKYLRMEMRDGFSNGQPVSRFSIVFYPSVVSFPSDKTDVFLMMAVSDEYDRYLKDLNAKNNSLVGIYNRRNTYSNIIGATGIFGACVRCVLKERTGKDNILGYGYNYWNKWQILYI